MSTNDWKPAKDLMVKAGMVFRCPKTQSLIFSLPKDDFAWCDGCGKKHLKADVEQVREVES